ncbi:MAG: phosphoribosyltransferase family protein [Bacteroidota bacterium]
MSIKREIKTLTTGLISLLYPRLCLSCRKVISHNQTPQLCANCQNELAYTQQWLLPENALTDRLAGRLSLTFGTSLLYFGKGTVCQQLIHALKYHHRPEIGQQLGEQLGKRLADQSALADLHGVVPVPIHPKRRHERGYNQAEEIGKGVAQALNIPLFPEALRRQVFKGSQTTRSRLERVENTKSSFINGKGNFSGKHLLLVDDVLTTGATLDFCGNLLLDHHPDAKISIATLAIATE